MINSFFDFCRKVNFEINLLELIKGLSTLVLISVIVLVAKRIVCIIKKERAIDERVRESRARIARAATEIEGYKEISKTKKCNMEPSTVPTKIEDTKSMIENGDLNNNEGEVPSIQEVSNIIQKEKKTRAMSMEERWAEYDKKRAIRNTA